MKTYYYFVVIVMFLGLVGCAANSNIAPSENPIKEINVLSQEEKVKLLALIEQYAQELRAQLDLSKQAQKDRQAPQDIKQIVIDSRILVALDEVIDQQILKELREKYERCVLRDGTKTHYLTDREQIKQFLDVHTAQKGRLFGSHKIPILTFNGRTGTVSIGTGFYPHYFHYVGKDGNERKISLKREMLAGYEITITPEIQPDSQAIAVNYLLEYSLSREDRGVIINGAESISTINEEDILKLKYKGKIIIPKSKTLVIECLPYGINLTEAEKRKRLLVFITCTINDNSVKATESTINPVTPN
ncbi:MAG: hypothetical protein HZA49_09185 [Planctomycetes bacterium]|nr:hypothetical protein [Planctomycetota bacterium]